MEQEVEEEVSETQLKIREELSNMSFEDILKLKEELGSKAYNEKVFNKRPRKNQFNNQFKRENKNRPREMSSKIPTPMLNICTDNKRTQIRDPRFDPLCGTYDAKKFNNHFKFINELKDNEYKTLKKELEETDDPVKIKKIKLVLQRMENQERERQKHLKEKEIDEEERTEQINALKQGKKAHFRSNAERKLAHHVEKYRELKEKGKLKKYIQKKRKSNIRKDYKNFIPT